MNPPRGPLGDHRRRKHSRHPYKAPLVAKCSSWDRFYELFSSNISKAGLFIPTATEAQQNEAIQVKLLTPDGEELDLSGKVVHVFKDKGGKQKGLGIHLDPLDDEFQQQYLGVVRDAASQSQIRPSSADCSDSFELPIEVDEPPEEEPLIKIETVLPAGPPPIPPAAKARVSPPPPPPPEVAKERPPPRREETPRPKIRRTADPIVVGIDFGTTWSSVAVVLGDEVTVLQQQGGSRQIPSVVGFLEDGSVVIGREAQALLASEPQNAIASPKRLLGRRYRDQELEPYLASMAIATSEGRDGCVLVHGQGTPYSIPQICAPIIYYLRQVAQEHLGEEVNQAVLTAPVSYEETRCSALREAAQLAGLETVEILDEPTAAAIAHNFDRDFKDLVAVYDFGGGTFDFSVVDTSKADLEVVATAGDIWLGGDDFDEAVANLAANAFWREHEIELRNQVVQWRRLLLASEKAKRQLSAKDEASVTLPRAALTQQGSIDLSRAITRAEFVDLAAPIIERSFDTCNDALTLSMIDPKELNAIYMSGGTTYIPAVREAVAAFFGKVGKVAVPPERAVVIGAAMYASRRYRERVQLLR